MGDSDAGAGETGARKPLSIPGKYLSLTSYRRDGTPVATAVWFIEDDGRLYVITPAESYKAKRLRRNPLATVAPSTARGTPTGDAVPAQVAFLPPEEFARIDRLMAERYKVRRLLIMPIYRLVMRLRGTPIGEHGGAYLEISSRAEPLPELEREDQVAHRGGLGEEGWWPASISTRLAARAANSRCSSAGVPRSWAQTR